LEIKIPFNYRKGIIRLRRVKEILNVITHLKADIGGTWRASQ